MTYLQEVKLKDRYHSGIVKSIVIHDVSYSGDYRLNETIPYGDIIIEGVNSDGYLLSYLDGKFKHLHYSDLPIRVLHTLHKRILTKQFHKHENK
jgi:hypothetical protein